MKGITKGRIAWLIILTLVLQMCAPIFALAQDNQPKMIVDGEEFALSIMPLEDEMGLMVGAEDVAAAFGLEYEFDISNKAFRIYDEINGEVVLMHNATQFYSGERIYDCAPYFYVKDGAPVIELGFFCTMFGSSYDYENGVITIHRNVLSENVARISIDGNEATLLVTPFENDLGLITDLESLAGVMGLTYEYNSDTMEVVLFSDEFGTVVLKDGATEFTSDQGVFACAPLFFVENNIPLIEVRFFCEMFGSSYEYNGKNKLLTIYRNEPFVYEEENEAELYYANGLIAGKITYAEPVPSNGLEVTLYLQRLGQRYEMYGGYQIYSGGVFNIGTVNIEEGETSKSYSFNVGDYYDSSYSSYALFFEAPSIGRCGYYNKSEGVTEITTSPYLVDWYITSSKIFSFYSTNTANIYIPKVGTLSGTVNLGNGLVAPSTGMPVDIIIQTRSETRSMLYGGSYYNVGANYNLGTVEVASGKSSKDFSYTVEQYYSASYPYYNVFYEIPVCGWLYTHGYIDQYYDITVTDYPLEDVYEGEWGMYPGARSFVLAELTAVDVNIPGTGYAPPAEKVALVTVGETQGRAGNTVSVDVSLSGCEGFANLALQVAYNSRYMTLLSVEPSSSIGATFTKAQSYTKNPFNFSFNKAENEYYNGELVTLTFQISSSAPDGYYPITVDYYKGVSGDYTDGYDVNYDEDFNSLGLRYTDGGITVKSYTPGDINGDDKVSDRDATYLMRYLIGWNISDIVKEALDVDGNGKVNERDATTLLRYLAGWDVELY